MIKAVLIDLDNTLLETQALYTAAEGDLAQFILALSPAEPQGVAEEIQRRKLVLFDQYGYDPEMLPKAFEQALVHFVPAATDDDILEARRLGRRIFEQEARLKDGVEEAVHELADNFALYLVTVGDETVQRSRIATLPFRDAFRDTFIVPDKNEQTYVSVLARCECAPHEAVMIGDSLKSDIIPAAAAGLTAIHIPGDNWHGREMQGLELPPERVVTYRTLREATNSLVIAQAKDAPLFTPKAPLARRPPFRPGY